jgi:hypothetical protein
VTAQVPAVWFAGSSVVPIVCSIMSSVLRGRMLCRVKAVEVEKRSIAEVRQLHRCLLYVLQQQDIVHSVQHYELSIEREDVVQGEGCGWEAEGHCGGT